MFYTFNCYDTVYNPIYGQNLCIGHHPIVNPIRGMKSLNCLHFVIQLFFSIHEPILTWLEHSKRKSCNENFMVDFLVNNNQLDCLILNKRYSDNKKLLLYSFNLGITFQIWTKITRVFVKL